MELERKYPYIILIGGKARSGKSTVCKYLYDFYKKDNKKIVISPYTKYLKQYIEDITEEKINENNKPRYLLQKLSSDLIKEELGYEDFFIKRQMQDINIYSYFKDVIIIPDVRFPKEIEDIKFKYPNTYSILVERTNYESELSEDERKDITETSLDNYDKCDYKIINDNKGKLKDIVYKIYKKINGDE